MTTRNIQSKMKDINENMSDFQSSTNSEPFSKSHSKTTSAKEDYIDFEEIK